MRSPVLLWGEGALDNYRAALEAAGLTVCRDPRQATSCGGLLLPGGGDIHGALDEPEHLLIQSFVTARRPILGICRGMQALNVFFGGTLWDFVPGHQLPHGDMVHPTRATGPVARLLGKTPAVNSNHHQAVNRLGAGLIVCQRTDDGVAEAICHRELPILGLQWHPERQSYGLRRADAVDASALFEAFASQME